MSPCANAIAQSVRTVPSSSAATHAREPTPS
uniref:Uncharacterized protein n=1 Tax=Arundo donax TaxID=35708 RepID=A0A0A9GPX6_ARUDO